MHPLEIDARSVQSLLEQQADFLLLDCREPAEHQTACIPQARLVPMSEIEQRLPELDAWRNKLVVVHCHHGGRSLRVANWLLAQGFSQARSLAGGIDRWSVEIDPAVPRY